MNRYNKTSQTLPVVWLEANQPVEAQIQLLRRTISTDATASRSDAGHLVRLALNEAEALAWQTEYPHLVFPVLAEEKLAELRRWESRQNSVWNDSFELAFAA